MGHTMGCRAGSPPGLGRPGAASTAVGPRNGFVAPFEAPTSWLLTNHRATRWEMRCLPLGAALMKGLQEVLSMSFRPALLLVYCFL